MYEALSRLTVLQATESWAGPGNEAMNWLHGIHCLIANIAGRYQYTEHLIELDRCRTSGAVPAEIQQIRTPLSWQEWASRLSGHPDQQFAQYVLQGIAQGFHIGFDPRCRLQPAKHNMRSATEHPEVIEKHLGEELQSGGLLGPFSPTEFPQVHINRFGVIPKSQPGKWRIITDLSYPQGASVNDGISQELASLSYITVDRVSSQIMQLGGGSLMAKVDIRSAYRLIPVHPADRRVLGVLWKEKLYVDTMLPFGLRSAPKIFTAVADAIEWCVRQ